MILSGKAGRKALWNQHKAPNQKKEYKWDKMGLNTGNGLFPNRKNVVMGDRLTKYGERVYFRGKIFGFIGIYVMKCNLVGK
ncbi:hypothetical protein EDM57_20925 [Brevibacillus gelatini]|uniref:Uncharacterized protein n=1 Tax=Brevibacillus gelatini TaxID=1655277 RepID=A0A3M8ANX2_9BACL|nr:hypothetical protein EDM57_20925 [Brevibacillus gelatini]